MSSGWQLYRCLKAGVLPFLRAAALFFHYLNSTAPPAELMSKMNTEQSSCNDSVTLCVHRSVCVCCSCRSWSVGGTVQLPQSALQPAAASPQPANTAEAAHTQVTPERGISYSKLPGKALPDTPVCVFSWCCHPGVRQTLQGGGAIIRFPRESNRLIELPEDYSVLINQASSFTSVNTQ